MTFKRARAHVIAMRADGPAFAHQQAKVRDAKAAGLRPARAGFRPSLEFHVTFPTAGTYPLWEQFRLADDDVITVPFTVNGRQPHPHERYSLQQRPL